MLHPSRLDMLVIRQSQIDRMSRAKHAEFVRQQVIRIQAAFGGAEQYGWPRRSDEPDLAREVARAIERAEIYGIFDQVDVGRFLDCCAEQGFNFDTDPSFAWAGDILGSRALTGFEKLNAIEDRLMFSDGES